jgi:hypothetical protein
MTTPSKPFNIDKKDVYEAYLRVRSNGGAAGVDGITLEDFEADLKGNLYKIWNRMSSGAYFPPPVRAVSIPKKSGGQRILGVPTVADRVAQTVVKQVIEPILDAVFLADSYGYRPDKSALDAVGVTRERCWKYDWVLEFDIRGLFDNIDHELLLRAVRKHVTCAWALLYIERWLTAPMLQEEGTMVERDRGTPQGGVVSRFWPTSSCTMRSISGWSAGFPTCPGVGMRMTGWYIAEMSTRRRSFEKRWRLAWRSAAWNCIQRRRRLSTARTIGVGASTRRSALTFSATASALDRSRGRARRTCSAGLPRRSASQR